MANKKLGPVGKYNTFKAISTVLTVGTPIITLACQSEFFVHTAGASISATGVFAILIAVLFLKDKIAEHFKTPSAFIVSVVLFVFIILVERILQPMKWVCLASMVASGVDELTFKRFYKQIEAIYPNGVKAYSFLGFLFTTTEKLTTVPEQEKVGETDEKQD